MAEHVILSLRHFPVMWSYWLCRNSELSHSPTNVQVSVCVPALSSLCMRFMNLVVFSKESPQQTEQIEKAPPALQ